MLMQTFWPKDFLSKNDSITCDKKNVFIKWFRGEFYGSKIFFKRKRWFENFVQAGWLLGGGGGGVQKWQNKRQLILEWPLSTPDECSYFFFEKQKIGTGTLISIYCKALCWTQLTGKGAIKIQLFLS